MTRNGPDRPPIYPPPPAAPADPFGATPGERLAAWLDQLREQRGFPSMRQFCAALDLPATTVSGWRAGKATSLEQLRNVATALGVPLGEVLLATGLASDADMHVNPTRVEYVYDADKAIDRDPKLYEAERVLLRQIRNAYRRAAEGEPDMQPLVNPSDTTTEGEE